MPLISIQVKKLQWHHHTFELYKLETIAFLHNRELREEKKKVPNTFKMVTQQLFHLQYFERQITPVLNILSVYEKL